MPTIIDRLLACPVPDDMEERHRFFTEAIVGGTGIQMEIPYDGEIADLLMRGVCSATESSPLGIPGRPSPSVPGTVATPERDTLTPTLSAFIRVILESHVTNISKFRASGCHGEVAKVSMLLVDMLANAYRLATASSVEQYVTDEHERMRQLPPGATVMRLYTYPGHGFYVLRTKGPDGGFTERVYDGATHFSRQELERRSQKHCYHPTVLQIPEEGLHCHLTRVAYAACGYKGDGEPFVLASAMDKKEKERSTCLQFTDQIYADVFSSQYQKLPEFPTVSGNCGFKNLLFCIRGALSPNGGLEFGFYGFLSNLVGTLESHCEAYEVRWTPQERTQLQNSLCGSQFVMATWPRARLIYHQPGETQRRRQQRPAGSRPWAARSSTSQSAPEAMTRPSSWRESHMNTALMMSMIGPAIVATMVLPGVEMQQTIDSMDQVTLGIDRMHDNMTGLAMLTLVAQQQARMAEMVAGMKRTSAKITQLGAGGSHHRQVTGLHQATFLLAVGVLCCRQLADATAYVAGSLGEGIRTLQMLQLCCSGWLELPGVGALALRNSQMHR